MSEKIEQGNFKALLEEPLYWEYGGEKYYVPSLGIEALELLADLEMTPEHLSQKLENEDKLSDEEKIELKRIRDKNNKLQKEMVKRTLELMFPENYEMLSKRISMEAFNSLRSMVISANSGRKKEKSESSDPQDS